MNFDEVYIRKEEVDLLKQLAEGKSVAKAAKALNKSKPTLENWKSVLFKKLGVKDKASLLSEATRKGILIILLSLTCLISYGQLSLPPTQLWTGGRMQYYLIGDSYCWPACNLRAYLISMIHYCKMSDTALVPQQIKMCLWDNDNDSLIRCHWQPREPILHMPEHWDSSCSFISNIAVVRYNWTVDLYPNVNGFTAAYQDGGF